MDVRSSPSRYQLLFAQVIMTVSIGISLSARCRRFIRAFEMVKFLIVHGADVSAANNKGETPLKIAQGLGVRQLLAAAGAKE